MRGYETWSFGNRPFLFALSLSALWHLFWFFSVTISVQPPRKVSQIKPRIVSLGAVIDDTIFRMLAEEKPQLSETFYRHLDDFAPAVEVKPQVLERREPGEVVSLSSRRDGSLIRDLVGGLKPAPEADLSSRVGLGIADETGRIEGAAAKRALREKPPMPALPDHLKPFDGSQATLRFHLTPTGTVTNIEIVVSSGNPQLDEIWVSWLKRWQFEPLALGQPPLDEEGRVRLRYSKDSSAEV